ncbi:hypothetical protein Tco_0180351, partial [Tanacetum coccineum]
RAKKDEHKEPPKETALCQAWCDVSENNIGGNSMKSKGFWDAVIRYFENETGSSRDVEMPALYNTQGRKKSKTSETTSGSASGGLNLNEEADEAVEET